MNFPSFPSLAPLLSFLPISTVKISLATEWLCCLLITRFQTAVLLLSFWNLSNHWTLFPAERGLQDLKALVKDVSSFSIHKQNWACVIMLCRQVSPHFCSCSVLISVPFCLQQKGRILWEEISPNTCSCIQGTKYLSPVALLQHCFLDLLFWRGVRGWVI